MLGRQRKRERESVCSGVSSSSYKATVLSDSGFTLMTSFNLNYLLKALSPDSITSGVRVSTYELVGGVGGNAGQSLAIISVYVMAIVFV